MKRKPAEKERHCVEIYKERFILLIGKLIWNQQERKLDQAVEQGRMSEEDAVQIMARAHREIEEVERSLHRHHEAEGEHSRERGGVRPLWEDEEELWEQVARGMKGSGSSRENVRA